MLSEQSRRAIITALNRCIEINTDAEKGYAIAAADVRDPTLKTRFLARVKERSDFVLQLQRAIRDLGGMPENEGSVKGALHRGVMEIERATLGRRDTNIVAECIVGETAALEGYEEALRNVFFRRLPPPLKELVETQYASIKRSLEFLREGWAA